MDNFEQVEQIEQVEQKLKLTKEKKPKLVKEKKPKLTKEELLRQADAKVRGFQASITPEIVTSILRDRHHYLLSITEIKNKYDIDSSTFKCINEYSEKFIETFGKREVLSIEELEEYWNKMKYKLDE